MASSSPSHAETAKHYGNMRFAMFTVFTTITIALLHFVFSETSTRFLADPYQRIGISVCGIVLSVLFSLAQYRISFLVVFYQKKAYRARALAVPDGHGRWAYVVCLTMMFPFIAAFVFWILLAFGLLKI